MPEDSDTLALGVGAGASTRSQVYCALDVAEPTAALALAREIHEPVDGFKLGLEFFTANGPDGVRAMRRCGRPLFLDLKLHDIPNTVAGAVRAVAGLRVRYLTVHAAGGAAMLRAARDAAAESPQPPRLLAITVLTSLDANDLGQLGFAHGPGDQVIRLADLALEAGMDGLVCSAHEVAALRERFGPRAVLAVPGIRPASADVGDQKRTMTPSEAQAAGADLLVIGRPITAATEPAQAAADIQADLLRDRP